MIKSGGIFILLFALFFAAKGQPAYSPRERANRDITWMQDSLHVNQEKSAKLLEIEVTYYTAMDKTNQQTTQIRAKTQARLIRKKDTAIKALLDKEQYIKYYVREKQIRAKAKLHYNGTHQPM